MRPLTKSPNKGTVLVVPVKDEVLNPPDFGLKSSVPTVGFGVRVGGGARDFQRICGLQLCNGLDVNHKLQHAGCEKAPDE